MAKCAAIAADVQQAATWQEEAQPLRSVDENESLE
jgi:hypothetical protein